MRKALNDEFLKTYAKKTALSKVLSKSLEEDKKLIKMILEDEDIKKLELNNVTLTLSERVTYDDEKVLQLVKSHQLNDLIETVEVVNKKKLKEELTKNKMLNAAYYLCKKNSSMTLNTTGSKIDSMMVKAEKYVDKL